MQDRFLEQLAEWEVPPPPEQFDEQLHHRVNDALVVFQVVEFAIRAVPWAMMHFAQALASAIVMSITGRHEPPPSRPRPM